MERLLLIWFIADTLLLIFSKTYRKERINYLINLGEKKGKKYVF